MNDTARVRIIEVEAVHQNAVDQRGVARGQARRQADHRHRALAPEAGDGRHRLVRELVTPGGIGDPGRIEHQMPGALAHVTWNGGSRQVVGKTREPLRDQAMLGLFRGHRGARAGDRIHGLSPHAALLPQHYAPAAPPQARRDE